MMTHSMTIKLVFRILYDALLMGERARRYFYRVQHAHKFDPDRIYPAHNIFDPTSRSTYQYEFFEAPMAQALWRYTNDLIHQMQLRIKVTTIDDILLAIHDLGGKSNILAIININLITLTVKAIWNTYVAQMAKWRTDDIQSVKKYAEKKILSSYATQLRQEIYQLPHHLNTIKIYNVYKDQRHRMLERDKCVMKTYTYNRKRLKDDQVKAYKNTWAKTRLITIEEGQQPNPHSTITIGPIIVMGPPPH